MEKEKMDKKTLLSPKKIRILKDFCTKLISPTECATFVQPSDERLGCWFGGGNVISFSGHNYLIGRYRDTGDSRFGVKRGQRGWKVVVWKYESYVNVLGKDNEFATLLKEEGVLSYEGSCLYIENDKMYCMLSRELKKDYPESVKSYQKEGTGIWSIAKFEIAKGKFNFIETVVESDNPKYLHCKDPNYTILNGDPYLIFCNSPFGWSSTCSSYMNLKTKKVVFGFFQPSLCWDVSVSRITCRFPVPKVGEFKDEPGLSLFFYDGCECIHSHSKKTKIPRGYSCEEISGVAYGFDAEFPVLHRISELFPLFYSPKGTGSLRYIWAREMTLGGMEATWQQSETDCSQPLKRRRVGEMETKMRLSARMGLKVKQVNGKVNEVQVAEWCNGKMVRKFMEEFTGLNHNLTKLVIGGRVWGFTKTVKEMWLELRKDEGQSMEEFYEKNVVLYLLNMIGGM